MLLHFEAYSSMSVVRLDSRPDKGAFCFVLLQPGATCTDGTTAAEAFLKDDLCRKERVKEKGESLMTMNITSSTMGQSEPRKSEHKQHGPWSPNILSSEQVFGQGRTAGTLERISKARSSQWRR